MTAGEKASGSLFPALPDALAWNDDRGELVTKADRVCAGFVRGRIWSICGGEGRASSTLPSLPPDWRHRIESAPETYRLVHVSTDEATPDIRRTLEGFYAVEEAAASYVEGNHRPAPFDPRLHGCWSALGDIRINGTGYTDAGLPPPYRRLGELTFAPVARETVIDGYTPFNALIFRHARWRAEHPRPAEFPAAVARVSAALEFVGSVSMAACRLLDSCLRTVVVARVPEHPHLPASASHPESPGLAAMTNLHSTAWSDRSVVQALVHESIHALITRVERADGMFEGVAEAPQDVPIDAVSPWSGRRFRLHNYVHACFVWFGLAQFWKRAAAAGVGAPELLDRAQKGFRQGAFLRGITTQAKAIIKPEVMASLQSLEAEANRD